MESLLSDASLFRLIKRELVSTVQLYLLIIRRPKLIWIGIYEVLRDIFYELPRGLLSRTKHKSLEQRLEESSSQSLIFSEIMTIPWNYIGYYFVKYLWWDKYTSTIIWANVGDYVFAILFWSTCYVLLTRGHGNLYTIKDALKTEIQAIKDCIPAAIVLYLAEAPIIGGLIMLWASPNLAIGINLIVEMTLFIGVAKLSYNTHIEEALSVRYKNKILWLL